MFQIRRARREPSCLPRSNLRVSPVESVRAVNTATTKSRYTWERSDSTRGGPRLRSRSITTSTRGAGTKSRRSNAWTTAASNQGNSSAATSVQRGTPRNRFAASCCTTRYALSGGFFARTSRLIVLVVTSKGMLENTLYLWAPFRRWHKETAAPRGCSGAERNPISVHVYGLRNPEAAQSPG